MIYYLTHVIYANGMKALACWCKDEKLTVTNHIYPKNQLFDVYLYTSRSCHFCIPADDFFKHGQWYLYDISLFSKLETITSVDGGGIAVVYCRPSPGSHPVDTACPRPVPEWLLPISPGVGILWFSVIPVRCPLPIPPHCALLRRHFLFRPQPAFQILVGCHSPRTSDRCASVVA